MWWKHVNVNLIYFHIFRWFKISFNQLKSLQHPIFSPGWTVKAPKLPGTPQSRVALVFNGWNLWVFLQIAQFFWHQFWDDYDWLRSWSLCEFVNVDIWFCMNVILFDKRRLMLFEPPSLTVLQPEPRSKSNAKPMETWNMNWQQKLKLYIEDGKISRNVVLPKFGFKWIFHYTNQTCTIHVHIIYTVIDRFRWYQRFGRPSDPIKRPSRPGRRWNWTCQRCLFSCGRKKHHFNWSKHALVGVWSNFI